MGQEFQFISYFRIIKISFPIGILLVIRKLGRPRFSKEYGKSFMMEEESHFIFAAFILLSAQPFFVGLIPYGLRAVLWSSRALKRLISTYIPAVGGRVLPLLSKVTDNASHIVNFNASLEMMIGFVFIFQAITGSQSFLTVMIWWQYLRMRYMMSPHTKFSFFSLRVTLDKALLGEGTYCPRFIGSLYEKLKSFLTAMTDPSQAQQRSMCVVM